MDTPSLRYEENTTTKEHDEYGHILVEIEDLEFEHHAHHGRTRGGSDELPDSVLSAIPSWAAPASPRYAAGRDRKHAGGCDDGGTDTEVLDYAEETRPLTHPGIGVRISKSMQPLLPFGFVRESCSRKHFFGHQEAPRVPGVPS